jgi:hypothetical protein
MTSRRVVTLLLLALPVAAHAQRDTTQRDTTARPAHVAAFLEASADRPEFASQRAEIVLQNVAEVVRQLGARVAGSDTVALGVSRLPEVLGPDAYPPRLFVARYVLRLRLADAADVPAVTTAISAAGAKQVHVLPFAEPRSPEGAGPPEE